MATFGLSACAGRSPRVAFGEGLASLDQRITEIVSDRRRRKAARAVVDETIDKLEKLDEILAAWRQQWELLGPASRADQAPMMSLVDTYNAKLETLLIDLCALAVALREHVERDEWARLFASGRGATPC